ncbi:MAG: hypothetical protein HRU15_19625, partial [Planctomycetes bacterium]|nr:hypothetical protein [Planctomycetota bacterium]
MQCVTEYPGCSKINASGGAARYRQWASDEVVTLGTCFWRQHAFFSLGKNPDHLFDLELPDAYKVSCMQRDWCGRRYRYQWDDDAVSLDLRTTLPGPLFQPDGTHLRLRTFTGSEWRDFEDLQTGQQIDCHGAESIDGGRMYYVGSDKVSVLIICSQPLRRVGVISHRHYDLEFAESGVKVMVVPLLFEDDVPRDAATQEKWLALVENPPLEIEETFSVTDTNIQVHGKSDSSLITLSPMLSLLGEKDKLVSRIDTGTTLLKTWCGPFVLIDAGEYHYDIAAKWMFARAALGNKAGGDFSVVPDEMSYAGDATWEPGSCMDQLFSIRSWAS